MRDDSGSSAVARTLAGGVLLGVVTAGVTAAWTWANDRPECSGAPFACAGEAILVAMIGIPTALAMAWLGLRALRTSSPGLSVALTFAVALVLPSVMDPPLWVWPGFVGALGSVVISLLGAVPRQGDATG